MQCGPGHAVSLALQGFQQTGDLSESLFDVHVSKLLKLFSRLLPVTLTQDLKRMAAHSVKEATDSEVAKQQALHQELMAPPGALRATPSASPTASPAAHQPTPSQWQAYMERVKRQSTNDQAMGPCQKYMKSPDVGGVTASSYGMPAV